MKMTRKVSILVLSFAMLFLIGCGQKQPWEAAGISEEFYAVTGDFAQRYLEFDQDGRQYDQALESVEAYLAGEKTQTDAISALEIAIDYFETELNGWENVSLDEVLTQQLQAVNISPAEYEAFANSRPSNLQTQKTDLSSLMYYLQYAEEDEGSVENLVWTVSKDQEIQNSMRGYYYYGCLNYWFPDVDGAEKDYLEIQVIDKVVSYIPEDPIWCSTREAAEEKVMLYLDEVEDVLNEFAEHIGQQQSLLYEMEQNLEAALNGQTDA